MLALLSAAPVTAQPRSPPERQMLSDLAYVLGESHALRQTCRGRQDDYWRSRMAALLKLEPGEKGLRDRVSRRFNAGFVAGRAAFPTCSARVRAQAARVASRGQALAADLARTAASG